MPLFDSTVLSWQLQTIRLVNSPEYADKLGQSWRHEAIVSRENGGPFMRTKKICCFQSRIESGQHYPGLFATKRWEGEQAAILVVGERWLSSNHWVFLVSSDDVDAILWPNIKVSKVYALFSSTHVFFIELCIFFTGSSVVKVSSCQITRL